MIKSILLTCCLVFSTFLAQHSFSQGDEKKGGIKIGKMAAARHEFQNNNYRGALLMYRDILKVEPNNAMAQYRSAECHYKLKRYDLALKYLDKAKANDPEVMKEMQFFYGQTYHRMARLDDAISSFKGYLENAPKRTIEYELAERYLGQCEYAQQLMKEPVRVDIQNVGKEINSRFDDYAPSVTSDGKTMVFTSRRSDTEGGEIDESSDYKFYEDIYISTWDEKLQEWTDNEKLPGDVNTDSYDAVLSIDPQGNNMFVYKNDAKLAGDIFMSKKNRTNGEWYAPEKLDKPVNSSFYEGSVSITRDGKTLYFISERIGGEGRGDIYRSELDKNGKWGKPKSLGDIINTKDDEKFVFIHPNGKTLYFSSKGHQTMGDYDIFKSELVDGEWGTPVNLGYPINTVNEESTFSLTADNTKLFLAAEYEDSAGERDIYMVDVSNYGLISKGYEKGTFVSIRGTITDDGSEAKNVLVKFYNAKSDRFVGEVTTDKDGKFKMNLPGNEKYTVKMASKKKSKTVDLDTSKNGKDGVAILNYEWQL
ncbi:MAG: tetratricopeptide repeat protein [Flavobacteriales bacterium]